MKNIIIFCAFLLMEQQWNEIDREKPKWKGNDLSQCHNVHHKSHMNKPEIEPSFRGGWLATNYLSHGMAVFVSKNHGY
jgi:hypothetical protein